MKRALIAIAFVCALASSLFFVHRTAHAQSTVMLAPIAHMQFLDANGTPLGGGCVFTYAAGTTTPLGTFVDSTGTISNPNPIVLDSGGFANIWLTSAAYKFVVYSSGGFNCLTGTYQWAVDNITTGAGASGSGTTANFVVSTLAPGPASNGIIRMATGDIVCWRNAANSGNLCVSKDSSDRLIWGGVSFFLTQGPVPSCITGADGIYADGGNNRMGMCNNVGGSDLIVGQNSTDVFTNKTLDTGATGNVFKITGTQITALAGTGGTLVTNTAPTISSATLSTATVTGETTTSPIVNGTPSGTGIQTTTRKAGSGSGDYTTTSVPMVQVDGTNLAYTVTVPTGWKLIASVDGVVSIPGGGGFGYLTLQDSVNGVLQGSEIFSNNSVAAGGGPPSGEPTGFAMQGVVNGDGMSHTVALYWGKVTAAYTLTLFNNSTQGFSVGPTMVFSLVPSN